VGLENLKTRIASSSGSKAFNALSGREKKRFLALTASSSLLAIFDLVGVVVFGLIGTLAIRGLQSISPSPRITSLLKFFNLENQDFRLVVLYLTLLASSFLLMKTLLSIFITRKQLIFLNYIGSNISNEILSNIFKGGLSRVSNTPPQDLRFVAQNGSRALANGILASLITVVADGVLLIVMICALLVASPSIAVISLILFSSFAYSLHKKQESAAFELGSRIAESSRFLDQTLTEMIFGFRILFVRGDFESRLDRLGSINTSFASLSAKSAFLPSIGKYILEAFLIFAVLSVIGIQFLFFDAAKSVGVIAMFFVSVSRVAPAILRIQQNLLNYRANSGTVNLTMSYMSELKREKTSTPYLLANNSSFQSKANDSFLPQVEVIDVEYRYEGRQESTLQGVNLRVSKGMRVAIIGKSGSGKSTLIDLILGLLTPSDGLIRLSGYEPKTAVSLYPGKISYLPQETFIFQGTLRDNISLESDPSQVNDDFIWELLQKVKLSSRFLGEPGLDILLGEGQTALSGGEKQRLGLARALYSNPQLLVLDEATSALDLSTEDEVMRSILYLREPLTVIAIAHRISSIATFDYIYILEGGRILDEGTFQELFERNCDFRNQVNLLRRR